MYEHQCHAHWPRSAQDSGACVCAVCGPDTAQRGENSFTVSCTYTPSGIVETAAECDAICTAAGATHCSFGWFNGSSCFAFTATCPGDCVLADNRAMISWQTCREAGDPVTPRVCAAEEPGGGGVQGALLALTCMNQCGGRGARCADCAHMHQCYKIPKSGLCVRCMCI